MSGHFPIRGHFNVPLVLVGFVLQSNTIWQRGMVLPEGLTRIILMHQDGRRQELDW